MTTTKGGRTQGGRPEVKIMEERSGEKHELNELNNRLEYYVEYQKEKRRDYLRMKDALEQADIEFDRKMKAKDEAHQKDLAAWQAARNDLNRDIALRRQDAKMYKDKEESLNRSNCSLEQQNTTLEKRTDQLEKALSNAQIALGDTRNNLDKKKRALEKAEKECADLDRANRELKGQNALLAGDNATFREEAKNLSESLAREKQARQKDVNTLKAQLHERELAQKRLEKEMRDEFERKLRKWIQARKRQYAEEKAEWMQIFQDEYNRKLKNLKEANEEKQKQINQLIRDKNHLNDQILNLNTTISGLERDRAALVSSNNTARLSLDAYREKVNNLQDALHRKAQEYQELLAAHVPLQEQIKRYEALLKEEEEATGFILVHDEIKHPVLLKKRKRIDVDDEHSYGSRPTAGGDIKDEKSP